MTTAVANKTKVQTFMDYFQSKKSGLVGIVPKHLTPDRVAKIAIASVMRNPVLLECDVATVWFQVAQAATLGLEVGLLGAAYLIPFNNRKNNTMDCQLIVGYQGLIDLARRSGHIESIEARVVHERDICFEVEYGLAPKLVHKPYMGEESPGKMIAVYGVAKLKDGGTQVEVMTKKDVEAIKARSKAKDSGPWVTDYEEMARKTVIRRLAKYLPKSIEMQQALVAEETTERDELPIIDIDLVPESVAVQAVENMGPSAKDRVKEALKKQRERAEKTAGELNEQAKEKAEVPADPDGFFNADPPNTPTEGEKT